MISFFYDQPISSSLAPFWYETNARRKWRLVKGTRKGRYLLVHLFVLDLLEDQLARECLGNPENPEGLQAQVHHDHPIKKGIPNRQNHYFIAKTFLIQKKHCSRIGPRSLYPPRWSQIWKIWVAATASCKWFLTHINAHWNYIKYQLSVHPYSLEALHTNTSGSPLFFTSNKTESFVVSSKRLERS